MSTDSGNPWTRWPPRAASSLPGGGSGSLRHHASSGIKDRNGDPQDARSRYTGRFATDGGDRRAVAEGERDAGVGDTEQFALHEWGAIEVFVHREVMAYAPDAWHWGYPDGAKSAERSASAATAACWSARGQWRMPSGRLAVEKEIEGLEQYMRPQAVRTDSSGDTCHRVARPAGARRVLVNCYKRGRRTRREVVAVRGTPGQTE